MWHRLQPVGVSPCKHETPQAKQNAEKVLFVIPSEARDLLFSSASKNQQIPRANPALRNDMVRVFPQPVKPVLLKNESSGSNVIHKNL
jgi:hypothetical protein